MPVSYTHLDVYKRQLRHREHIPVNVIEPDGDVPCKLQMLHLCLLYTSGELPKYKPTDEVVMGRRVVIKMIDPVPAGNLLYLAQIHQQI